MIEQGFNFEIASELQATGIQGVFLVMTGLFNRDTDLVFDEMSAQIVKEIRSKTALETVRAEANLRGYRELHSTFGFSNETFPALPETLFEAIFRTGRFTHVNLLADICNLVAVENRLVVAGFDLAQVSGNIHLRLLSGSERYCPRGAFEAQVVRVGGYAYIDDADAVLCLLDSRPAEKSHISLNTRTSFFLIQGNARTSARQLTQAAERLVDLATRFCGGEVVYSCDVLYQTVQ